MLTEALGQMITLPELKHKPILIFATFPGHANSMSLEEISTRCAEIVPRL